MKRLGVLVLALAMAATLTSCDFAKVNAKCKVGAPFARDNTHVLQCQGGRWKQLITIQQAADIIVGQLPGTITREGDAPKVNGKEPFTISFKVLKRNGQPAAKEKVTLTGAAKNSESAGIVAPVTVEADANGIATITATANDKLGAFDVTATVGDKSLIQPLTSTAGPLAKLVKETGDGQVGPKNGDYPVPLAVMATDKNGFPIENVTINFQPQLTGPLVSANKVATSFSGRAAVVAKAQAFAGSFSIVAFVDAPGVAAAIFTVTVL